MSHLAAYRPGHYIRTLYGTPEELEIVFRAALGIAGVAASPYEAPPGFTKVGDTREALLTYLQPVQVSNLRHVARVFAEPTESADMKVWLDALTFTEDRAGFLLTQDLSAARKMTAGEPRMSRMPTGAERMAELYAFVVSEEHARLRQALGISLNRLDARDPYTGEMLPSGPLELPEPEPPSSLARTSAALASSGDTAMVKRMLVALALLGLLALLGYWALVVA